MSYIDVLIPLIFGLLLVFSPKSFTKAEGENFEAAKKKFQLIGYVLIAVSALYLIIKLAS